MFRESCLDSPSSKESGKIAFFCFCFSIVFFLFRHLPNSPQILFDVIFLISQDSVNFGVVCFSINLIGICWIPSDFSRFLILWSNCCRKSACGSATKLLNISSETVMWKVICVRSKRWQELNLQWITHRWFTKDIRATISCYDVMI